MYLSFYRLREEPFRLTPDPRFFHLAEVHRTVLVELLRGVVCRKGFMVVTGPVGTGKTTLLHTAMGILSAKYAVDNKLLSAFLVNPTLTRDEFLEAILEEMEISCRSASKPQRLLALQGALVATQRRGGTAVLIVDEAHMLTRDLLEEIRLLSNTETQREKLLQVILCGQPEMSDLLADPRASALQQRVAVRCSLRTLTIVETGEYIVERLRAAGLREASPFTKQAVDDIYLLTRGIPRLINLLCDRSLIRGWELQATEIASDIVNDAALSLGLVDTCLSAEPRSPNQDDALPHVGDEISSV
jgi:general secretion pathway protein A